MKLKKKNWLKHFLCLALTFSIVFSATATTAFAEDFPSKADLQGMVDYASELTEDDNMGTEEDWVNLQVAIVAANDVIDKQDATQEEIETAYDNLIDCIDLVEWAELVVEISELEELISIAERVPAPPVVRESWDYFLEALSAAKELVSNPDTATDDDIFYAYIGLAGSMYLHLQDLIYEASYLKANDYTADSWGAYQVALKGAKEILDDLDATDYDHYDALINLATARAGLVEATTSTGSAGSSSSGNSASTQSSNGSKSAPVPKTGDTAALSIVSVTVLAAAALVILKKKRVV